MSLSAVVGCDSRLKSTWRLGTAIDYERLQTARNTNTLFLWTILHDVQVGGILSSGSKGAQTQRLSVRLPRHIPLFEETIKRETMENTERTYTATADELNTEIANYLKKVGGY